MSNRRLVPLNVYASASEPAGSRAGDMYFNTTTSKTYVYDGSAWIVAGGAGGGVTASETVPENPEVGSGWFNTATGNLYIYYDSYWVEVGANGGMPGPQGEPGVVTATSPLTYDAGTQTVGIDQTGITVAQSQVTNLTTDLAAKASTSDLSTHAADTTSVHGIADTSLLATKSYADTSASTAASARVSKTGDTVTGDLDVSGALTGSVVSGKDPEEILREAVWWIDAAHAGPGQTVPNLGWGGSTLDAQVGSTGSADSNDPKYLDWTGENYIYLPGATGNYLSVPDEAATRITGDIEIICDVSLDDWTPASNQRLVSRYGASGNRGYLLSINATGTIGFVWTEDGSTIISRPSNAAIAAPDGSRLKIKVTLDVDNDSSGHDVSYFTSTDNGDTWTQLGTTITTAGVTSIFAATGSTTLGESSGSPSPLAAKVYRAQVLDGIDGTPVLDVDCSAVESGSATSFLAKTGQTVSINRSTSGRKAVSVTHPTWLFGSDDYMQVADSDLIDFEAGDSFTVLLSGRYFGNASTHSNPLTKQVTAGAGYALRFSSTDTAWYSLLTDTDGLTGNRGVLGGLGDTFTFSVTVERSTGLRHVDVNGARYTDSAASMTSFENNVPLRIGSRSDQVNYNSPMEFTAAAIFRRALSAEELSALSNYFQTRSGYAIPRNDRATLIKSTNGARYQLTVDDDGSLVTTEL